MSKMLDSTTVRGHVSKIFETSDNFIINSQVYNKETLEPLKFNTIYYQTGLSDLVMNYCCRANENNDLAYYNENVVLTDKYNHKYSYAIFIDRGPSINILKFSTNDDGSITLEKEYKKSFTMSYLNIYSQDVNFIYGSYTDTLQKEFMFKINKQTLSLEQLSITRNHSKIKFLKDTPLYIYYAYSTVADNFYIGKYNKSSHSKTDIYNDNGTNATEFNSFFRTMKVNDNEVITLRANKSFNNLGIDNLVLKKYIIDYDYEKVYSKSIELDCSLVPKGIISRIDSSTYFTETHYFRINNKDYFVFWNKYDKILYLASKTSENIYSIIQVYELANGYNGIMPYNNGETIILYNQSSIDFISFRGLEEKYELTTSLKGSFTNVGIDKNNTIWIQNADGSVDMVGLNLPTIAEALFIEDQIDYKNTDIETFIEVFCKNFNGDLIETNVEIFLTGSIYFSDTQNKKKKVRTSSNNTIRIPVTINNSGLVETNVKIL